MVIQWPRITRKDKLELEMSLARKQNPQWLKQEKKSKREKLYITENEP